MPHANPVATLNELILDAKRQVINPLFGEKILPFLDLTRLNQPDTAEEIITLCQKAHSDLGQVAAVCIYPEHVPLVKTHLPNTIKICTVANFPHGTDNLATTLQSIQKSIDQGAHEIDIVMPYALFLEGKHSIVGEFIRHCKEACGVNTLKVILETGILQTYEHIHAASCLAIENNADFIKTSTGKIHINATLEAAAIMLTALKNLNPNAGFKAAGGIKTQDQAATYFYLAERIMGKKWVRPSHFRLGASILLDNLLLAISPHFY